MDERGTTDRRRIRLAADLIPPLVAVTDTGSAQTLATNPGMAAVAGPVATPGA